MEGERGTALMERLKLEFYYGQEAEQFTFYRLPKALITDDRFKDMIMFLKEAKNQFVSKLEWLYLQRGHKSFLKLF